MLESSARHWKRMLLGQCCTIMMAQSSVLSSQFLRSDQYLHFGLVLFHLPFECEFWYESKLNSESLTVVVQTLDLLDLCEQAGSPA